MKLDPLNDTISHVGYYSHMGSDLSVVYAARVSFGKESQAEDWATAWPGMSVAMVSEADQKLINYLAKHNHWTPFGHAQLTLRVKAPIFVARQLVKHQVGLVWNEVSRRYVSDIPEVYIPKNLRLRPEGSIKQGSSDETTELFNDQLQFRLYGALKLYNQMVGQGVAPEEARMVLPLSCYTEWMWTGSLAAWLRIINLRCDPHAQSQTRQYGEAFAKIVQALFPASYAAHFPNQVTSATEVFNSTTNQVMDKQPDGEWLPRFPA